MPSALKYIVGNEACERFGYYGMRAILMIFMTKYVFDSYGNPEFSEIESMIWFHNFISASYFFTIIGAFISEFIEINKRMDLNKPKIIRDYTPINQLGALTLGK